MSGALSVNVPAVTVVVLSFVNPDGAAVGHCPGLR